MDQLAENTGSMDPAWALVWEIRTDAWSFQSSNAFGMPWNRTWLLSCLGSLRIKSCHASGDEEKKTQVWQGWQWQIWVLRLLVYVRWWAGLSPESCNCSFWLCFTSSLKLGPKPSSSVLPGHCSPGCSVSKGSASFLLFFFCWKAPFFYSHMRMNTIH